MQTATAVKTKALIAIGSLLVAVIVSLPGELVGQDAAGSAMLAGILGLPALVISVVLGFQAWRGESTYGSHDRVTVWIGRMPLLLLAVLMTVAALAAVSGL